MNIDEIDLDILRELTSNARAPLSAISDKVMLSVPAVSERIKKLEIGGFISKYSAILDPSKFNKNLSCYTFVTLRYDETKLEAFRKFVENEPDINECHLITGEYEYVLKIITASPDSLGNLLDSLRKNADVLTSSTSIVLSSLRQDVSIRV
jgi:Lrp/AsnC family leucine-responsive transcriptional regulator